MNLDQYVQDAVRTESKIDKVILEDVKVFLQALQIFIASGNILDVYKKNVFYGKPIDWEKVVGEFENIENDCAFFTEGQGGKLSIDPRVFHALIGIATEATELMEALHLAMKDDELDYINVLEELGDVNWYQAIGIDAMEGNFEKVLTTNIEKLRKRFPDKFTNEDAIERDLNEERNTLETGLASVSKDGRVG
jgi:NTP pyrophosphatase (non-canonical NTP hydrolase)